MQIDIDNYKELETAIKAFSRKNGLNMLFIVGRQGQSKTQRIKAALGDNSLWMEGQVTAFGLYIALYQDMMTKRGNTEFVVLDDVNTVRNDDHLVRLLKCLCQTDDVKNVAWHTTNHKLEAENIPQSYSTKARVCFIVNEGSTKNPHFAALADRGVVIHFAPPPEEVLRECRKWFKDKVIIKFVEDHMKYINHLSMRDMIHASKCRETGMEWKKGLAKSFDMKALNVVDRLLNESKYTTDEKRIKAFADETGLSRTTWFQLTKKLKGLDKKESPRMVLSMDGILKGTEPKPKVKRATPKAKAKTKTPTPKVKTGPARKAARRA